MSSDSDSNPNFPALEPVTTFPIAVDIQPPERVGYSRGLQIDPGVHKQVLKMLADASNDVWEVERIIRRELCLPFGGTGSDKTTAAQVLHDGLFAAIYALTMLRHAVEIINTSTAADGRKVS